VTWDGLCRGLQKARDDNQYRNRYSSR